LLAMSGDPHIGMYALLDVGSHRVACTVVEAGPQGRVLGYAEAPSQGIVAGDVRDVRLAHGSLVKAIVDAERMAGTEANRALVAVGCGCIAAVRVTADVALDLPVVTVADISRLRGGLLSHVERAGRVAVHVADLGYVLDGRRFVKAPVDRFGRTLELEMLAVTVDGAPLRRVLEAVEATGVPVGGVVPAGYAAALALTTSSEQAAGVALVDIGADHTTVTVLTASGLVSLGTIAIGLRQVIADVASSLQLSYSKAERIILDYGSDGIAHAEQPEADMLRVDGGTSSLPTPGVSTPWAAGSQARATPNESLAPRLDTMLRLVADRIDASNACPSERSTLVLTGGGSQVRGLAGYAAHLWGRAVRTDVPATFDGLRSPFGEQSSAVMRGLLLAARQGQSLGVRFARQDLARHVA
jgi:cell division protein FtsA